MKLLILLFLMFPFMSYSGLERVDGEFLCSQERKKWGDAITEYRSLNEAQAEAWKVQARQSVRASELNENVKTVKDEFKTAKETLFESYKDFHNCVNQAGTNNNSDRPICSQENQKVMEANQRASDLESAFEQAFNEWKEVAEEAYRLNNEWEETVRSRKEVGDKMEHERVKYDECMYENYKVPIPEKHTDSYR